jgi:S-(hydroxymethyl)mycothiol dehydrogenase
LVGAIITGENVVAHQVRAVVAPGKGAPVQVETINVPDPGAGEALV